MHEPVTDSENRSWTPGPELGRGVWARTFGVVGPDGTRALLKIPLGPEDLSSDDPDEARALAAACRAAAEHQVAVLREESDPARGELVTTVGLPDGRTALVLPAVGPSLAELGPFDVAGAIERALILARALERAPRPHGDLRPDNVFFDETGPPDRVVFVDWLTEPVGARREALARRADAAGWAPPDAGPRPATGDDTWALARWLHQALLGEIPPPRGLDRAELRAVRERLVQRLIEEERLPRFVDRTADRLSTLLGRALSVEAEPSPPFRFHGWPAFLERLEEARALLEPAVVDVGPIVWPAWRPDETFGADEPVAFTVRVGGSPGLEEPGDIVCGLRVDAITADGPVRVPVPGAAVQVRAERGSRFRFRLELPPLAAGTYRVIAAFAVQGTGAEPTRAVAEFAVDPTSLPASPPPATPEGVFVQERTTIVPDGADDPDGLAGDLPDPRVSEEGTAESGEDLHALGPSVLPATDDGTFPRAWEDRPAPVAGADRGVGWVLGLSAALAMLAVLSYVARSC